MQWAISVDEDARKFEADIRAHVAVYLVPPDAHEEQESAPLKKWFAAVFERELEGWYTDESTWPKRDLRTFKKWFDVSMHSLVVDLGRDPVCIVEL